MTFRTEFPDFDPATMPTIPDIWRDVSWHNELAPTFRVADVLVIVDYEDPDMRELVDSKRFLVLRADTVDELLETDEWAEVLRFVEARL